MYIDIITSCIYEITTNFIFLKKKVILYYRFSSNNTYFKENDEPNSIVFYILNVPPVAQILIVYFECATGGTNFDCIFWMCHRWHISIWVKWSNQKNFFFHQKKFQIIFSGISEKKFKKYYFLGGHEIQG